MIKESLITVLMVIALLLLDAVGEPSGQVGSGMAILCII